MKFLEWIGRVLLRALEELGRFFQMLGQTAGWSIRPPFDVPELFRQMVRVGVDSVPVVFLTTLFTGMVLALQTYHGFARFHAEGFVGSVVALSLTRELAPVLTALMVTGRVGSAMAAELGTMRVTEQIDALTALGTEPVQYLVAVQLFGANPITYTDNSFQFLELSDVTSGIVKAAVFGLIFSLVACVRGYYTEGGAEGVGRSTTRAVVGGSLSILFADFFLTKLLF